jgi:hypothetical protein
MVEQNKDVEYVQNQQQNIVDAIDLIPCPATGIDVNVRFRQYVNLPIIFHSICLLPN